MSQKFKECTTCHHYGFFGTGIMPQHQCKQTWNVWPDSEYNAEATKLYRLVYAEDAESAACAAGSAWSDDEPFDGLVHVRQWDGDEDEQGPTASFELTPRYELVFEVVTK